MIIARPFNLVGPGLDARLALGSFARQLAAVLRGEVARVECGPLEARRDYLDVRDAVEAYLALADLGLPGEVVHVCSGKSYRLGDLLAQMIELAGVAVEVHVSRSRRQSDPLEIMGDYGKLARRTGWRPRIAMRTSLADMLQAAIAANRPAHGCLSR